MSTLTLPAAAPELATATNGVPLPPVVRREPFRLTTGQYDRMVQSGILGEADPVELLEGLLVNKMARNPKHDGTLIIVEEALRPKLPANWLLRSQMALLTPDSRPEPDLVVVPGPSRRYLKLHPTAGEVPLVIEVADSSLEDDRDRKGRIYARAAIPVYWLINLIDNQVEVYTDPTGLDENPRYRGREDLKTPAAVPLVIGGVEVARIPVAELLP